MCGIHLELDNFMFWAASHKNGAAVNCESLFADCHRSRFSAYSSSIWNSNHYSWNLLQELD